MSLCMGILMCFHPKPFWNIWLKSVTKKLRCPTSCLAKAWADLDDYVELVASSNLHEYVPLDPEERYSPRETVAAAKERHHHLAAEM